MVPDNMTSNESVEETGELLSDEEILAEAERLAEQEAAAEKERKEALDNLAVTIESRFFKRAIQRKPKEAEWRKSMELYLGNLSVDAFASSDRPFTADPGKQRNRPYHNIVANKCDIAIAQSVDMQFAGGEKNWSLSAAVTVDDPAETQRARDMEREIQTQLERCAYGRKARRAIEDRVILGTGVLKGPVNTGKLYTKYAPMDPEGTIWAPIPAVTSEPSIERVNPWFFYPDDSVNEFEKVSDCIEVHPYSVYELRKLRNHPGFIKDAIDEVIETKPDKYMDMYYSDYKGITEGNPYLFEDKYMVLEYHGPISVEDLAKLSIEPSYEAESDEYYGEVWVVAGKVIRVELENIEASFEVPYAVSCWKKDPNSVFGFGSPLMMNDAQRVAKETWRMILDNAAMSSGPQVAMHRTYVEPANGKWEFNPGKVWQLQDSQVDVNKAIQFFNVPNVAAALTPILEMARKFAEEESSTPMVAGGLQGGELSESATGSLLIRDSSTTVLDFLSEDWDDNVTEKVIRRMYAWNMQYNPNPSIKGNYSVDVKTVSEYKSNQMAVRDLERLDMSIKQDPEAAMVVNRDELLRARFAAMHIPSDAIIRTPEQVEAIRQQQANQPNPAMIEMQARMKELQLKEREVVLREKEIELKAQTDMLRAQMDHKEKMSANYARTVEAHAAVVKTQNEKDIARLNLAAKMSSEAERNAVAEKVAIMNNETKQFTAELQANLKARDNLLVAKELKLKEDTGSGI